MKKIDKKLIDKLFLIIISVQTVLMGLLFIIQICRIYFADPNGRPYSREICGQYLGQILVVIIIWILLIIASGIYFIITSKDKKIFAKTSNITKLKILLLNAPDFTNENLNKEYELIKKEEKKRLIYKIVNISILIICSVMGLCYLLNVKHFDTNVIGENVSVTNQIVDMTFYLLPWVIISFASFIIFTILEEISAKNSIELIKLVIKTAGKKVIEYQEDKRKKLAINIARGVIITIAVIFIIVGINNGGAKDVLRKAINICTECIGLG